jgi:malate dehydrogenase (oxaloacetate-decarboxylating)(NADP+)
LADGDAASARITAEEALALHASGRPGKLDVELGEQAAGARRPVLLELFQGLAAKIVAVHKEENAGLGGLV